MSNGWPDARRARRASLVVVLLMLPVAAAGCARGRQGMLGGAEAKPSTPMLGVTRPEPGLRVRAPFVDVQVADRDEDAGASDAKGDGATVKVSREPTTISSRVGLFRSPQPSGRSLGEESPLN